MVPKFPSRSVLIVFLTFPIAAALGEVSYSVEENLLIENQVQDCIKVIPKTFYKESGLLRLSTNWEVVKSTGYCGCKSALISYRVSATLSPSLKREISYGVLSSLHKRSYDFVISHDEMVSSYRSFRLEITCKSPE